MIACPRLCIITIISFCVQIQCGLIDLDKVEIKDEKYNTIHTQFNHRTLLEGFKVESSKPYPMIDLPFIGNPYQLPEKWVGLPEATIHGKPPSKSCMVSAICGPKEICQNSVCTKKPNDGAFLDNMAYHRFIYGQQNQNPNYLSQMNNDILRTELRIKPPTQDYFVQQASQIKNPAPVTAQAAEKPCRYYCKLRDQIEDMRAARTHKL